MKKSIEFADRVQKAGLMIDIPFGGSNLHVWKRIEKYPMCRRRVIRGCRWSISLTGNWCPVCAELAEKFIRERSRRDRHENAHR